jgi:hypothetical protein
MLQLLTAVLRDCEFSGKITFSYRKKFYLSRKFSVTKFATSQSRETLGCIAVDDQQSILIRNFSSENT